MPSIFVVSYRYLEELMAKRGVAVDHATLNRRAEKYAKVAADEARRWKGQPVDPGDGTQPKIKIKGKWAYLYRTVDNHGKPFNFTLSERRDEASATALFAKAIENNGWPDKVGIDRIGSNRASLFNMN